MILPTSYFSSSTKVDMCPPILVRFPSVTVASRLIPSLGDQLYKHLLVTNISFPWRQLSFHVEKKNVSNSRSLACHRETSGNSFLSGKTVVLFNWTETKHRVTQLHNAFQVIAPSQVASFQIKSLSLMVKLGKRGYLAIYPTWSMKGDWRKY